MGCQRTASEETHGNANAIRCLSDAIDGSGITRAELASRARIGEPQLSKLTHSAAIELLDQLPDEVLIPWLQRYGRERGFEVREILPREIDDEMLAAVGRLIQLGQLRRVRTKQIKASLPLAQESRRHA